MWVMWVKHKQVRKYHMCSREDTNNAYKVNSFLASFIWYCADVPLSNYSLTLRALPFDKCCFGATSSALDISAISVLKHCFAMSEFTKRAPGTSFSSNNNTIAMIAAIVCPIVTWPTFAVRSYEYLWAVLTSFVNSAVSSLHRELTFSTFLINRTAALWQFSLSSGLNPRIRTLLCLYCTARYHWMPEVFQSASPAVPLSAQLSSGLAIAQLCPSPDHGVQL